MEKPWVQIAIGVLEIDKARKLPYIALQAGADRVEVGIPLILFKGVSAIGKVVKIC